MCIQERRVLSPIGSIGMDFKTDEEKEKFLKDIPFYDSTDSYCLGDTLESAGKIIKVIAENKELQNERQRLEINRR